METKGALAGCRLRGCNPRAEIPAPLSLYQAGRLELDGLITTMYRLEDINQEYQDMRDGKNIHGMVVCRQADR